MIIALIALLTDAVPILIRIVEAIVAFFKDIAYIIETLFKVIQRIGGLFFWLPSEVFLIFGTVFTFVFVYKVLGREG